MIVLDFIVRSFELDMGGWLVLLAFGGAGYTLISQMLGDQGSAMLGAPILVLGGAIGNRAFSEIGIQLASDKLVNMTIGMAAGMFVGSLLMVLVMWSWNATMAR